MCIYVLCMCSTRSLQFMRCLLKISDLLKKRSQLGHRKHLKIEAILFVWKIWLLNLTNFTVFFHFFQKFAPLIFEHILILEGQNHEWIRCVQLFPLQEAFHKGSYPDFDLNSVNSWDISASRLLWPSKYIDNARKMQRWYLYGCLLLFFLSVLVKIQVIQSLETSLGSF